MSTVCKGKGAWPELVGKDGKEAEKIIEKENPLVDGIIVDEGSIVIQDFRCDRVWIWVKKTTNIVTQTPVIG